MIFVEKGKPIDFEYLEINNSFERFTGLKRKAVLGKKSWKRYPVLKKPILNYSKFTAELQLPAEKESEIFFKPLSKWFSISVYCPQKGYFAAVFEDTIKRKKMEQELSHSRRNPSG